MKKIMALKQKQIIYPFFLSFSLQLIVTWPMNGFSYGWSSIIVSVTFIMLTYILIDKNEPKDFKNVLWSIIGGKIWLEVLIRMFFFKDSLCSLMLSLFQAWNIIMTAWFYKKRSKTIIAIWIAGWIIFLFWGHMAWQEFVFGKEETFYDMYIHELLDR